MTDSLSDLFALADAYGAAKSLSESSVSGLVLKGGNRLRDLRLGNADIGVQRLKTAIEWFASNWPDNAVWPKGVKRPKPSAQVEADPDADEGRRPPRSAA